MTADELADVLEAGYLAASGKEPGVVAEALYAMWQKARELAAPPPEQVISGPASPDDGGDG